MSTRKPTACFRRASDSRSISRQRRFGGGAVVYGTEVTSVAMSATTSTQCLQIVLLVAAAVRTSNGVLTQADCETHEDGSRSYHACTAGPEHILRPGNAIFNTTVDPPNSTCGLTPQTSCTLVCISTSATLVIGFA